MNKRIKWLEELSKAKQRRADKLKERIVVYAKMEDEHIPLMITEKNLEKIAFMSIKKRTTKEQKTLEVLDMYLKTRTLQAIPSVKSLGVNDFQLDILVLLYTYESLKFVDFEKMVKYRRNVGRDRLRNYYLKPLVDMGLVTMIRLNPKVKFTNTTFMLSAQGRRKMEGFAEHLMKDMFHPIKIYDEYVRKSSKRNPVKNENDTWKYFGFPIRPIGEEESATDRRNRVRGGKQIQLESEGT